MIRILATLCVSLITSVAWAYPLAKPGMSVRSGISLESLGPYAMEHDFTGIVGLSNCSGSIVRFENSRDRDHALVMTNGHCLESGMPKPGTFVIGQESHRRFSVLAKDADQSWGNGSLGTVTANLVVYSTMTKTDLTLYRLNETYADILQKFNTPALLLAKEHPAVGNPIEVISGYWKRGYACHIETFVSHLEEEGWVSEDSMRYSRPGCETIGGTSGSPVVLQGTRTVIGINNTGNDDGALCTMDNPCEVDDQGHKEAHKGYSYGQETYWLYSCLNSNNEVDVSTPGCQLPH